MKLSAVATLGAMLVLPHVAKGQPVTPEMQGLCGEGARAVACSTLTEDELDQLEKRERIAVSECAREAFSRCVSKPDADPNNCGSIQQNKADLAACKEEAVTPAKLTAEVCQDRVEAALLRGAEQQGRVDAVQRGYSFNDMGPTLMPNIASSLDGGSVADTADEWHMMCMEALGYGGFY